MASADRDLRPAVWLIAGPTASGKSALALNLAARTGAEIVNADASQVYADLPILSARPTEVETDRAPHHLYGSVDGAQAWSVGLWLRAVLPVLQDIRDRGRTALVVGGTGLYFHALTRGLAEAPDVPEAVRAAVQQRYDTVGETAIRGELAIVDPAAEARIAAHDRQRLVRALAVAEATGRSLSDWQLATCPPLDRSDWRGVVLEPPRQALYARCDARVEQMLRDGVLDEVARLADRGLDPGLPVMKAVGYRWLAAYLRGELGLGDAVAATQQDTRRYAKRQLTWFRNQTPDWDRISAIDPHEQLAQLSRLVSAGSGASGGEG
jgi:tRNA dimethylallyltransferase